MGGEDEVVVIGEERFGKVEGADSGGKGYTNIYVLCVYTYSQYY